MAHVPVEKRSRQIIEAASTIIREEGLGGATTRRIAERANAPLGTLHYTFRNKEELVAAVYALWMESAAEQVTGIITKGCGLEMGVRTVMSAFFERNAVDEAARRVGMAEWELFVWAFRSSPDLNLGARVYERYTGICVDALTRAAGDAADADAIKDLASFMCCAIDGCLVKLLATGDAPAARAELERFTELAVRLAS